MNDRNTHIKKILLLAAVGGVLLIGQATYSKIQRDKRQRMMEVIQEAKQSLKRVQTNPHHLQKLNTDLNKPILVQDKPL